MWECAAEAQSIAAVEGWHCPTCLSRRRPMETLSPQAYNLLSILIANEEQFDVIPPGEVCWECAGRLLSMLKFQERALRAMSLLLTCDIKPETNSFSFLTEATKSGFDYEFQDCSEEEDKEKNGKSLIKVKVNKLPNVPRKTKNHTFRIEPMKNETKTIEVTAREPLKRKKKSADSRVRKMYISSEEMLRIRERDRKREEYVKSPYKCETCIKPFNHKDLLDRHNMIKHNKDAPHECDICGQRFERAAPLAGHRLRHRALFACAACEFASRSGPEPVKRHYADAHAPDDVAKTSGARLRYHRLEKDREMGQCDVCNKVMVKFNLSRHISLIHGGAARCRCELCGVALRDEASRATHVRRMHPADGRGAHCAECDVRFRSQYNYAVHLRRSLRHNPAEKFKFHCDKCNQKFLSKGQLMHHQKNDHEEYPCYMCDKRLKTYASLRQHVRFVHEGATLERRHVCEACGKRFQSSNALAIHKLTHTGERPHACDICGARFTQKSALTTHVRLVHLKLGRKAPQKRRAVR